MYLAGVGRLRCCTRVPRGHRQSHPTAIQPTSHDPQPQKPHHRKPPHPTHAPAPDALTHHNPNTKPNRSRAGTGPISRRSTTDLEPEPDRSRHGVRPISTRNSTDLDAGCDRSRAGTGPISTRVATDLDTGCDRSRRGLARGAGCGRAPASISSEASREPVRRRLRKSSGRAGRCPYAAQPCGRPRRSHR